MSAWGLLGAALEGAGKGGAVAIANQHAVDAANALKEQRIQEMQMQFGLQSGVNRQQSILQADLNDRNAARDDARGMIAKGQDNSAALDLYKSKKDIDLKAEADPAMIKAKTDLYNAQHPYDEGEFQLKVADTQSKIDERIQSAANKAESEAWNKLKYQHEAAAKELESYNKAINEGTVPGDSAERHKFNLGRDAVQMKFDALDAKINGVDEMGSPAQPSNDPANVRDPEPTQKAAAKPLSRAQLEEKYLTIVSRNKPYLKTLSDEDIVKAIKAAESDQALAKKQKSERENLVQSEQNNPQQTGMLKNVANPRNHGGSKFIGNLEGYL